MNTPTQFTLDEVLKLTEITYRQLDHWANIGIIKNQTNIGKGNSRKFSVDDIYLIWIAKELRSLGINSDTIKTFIQAFTDKELIFDEKFSFIYDSVTLTLDFAKLHSKLSMV